MQEHFGFFERNKVEATFVRFGGEPDAIIQKSEYGEKVAYIVLGEINRIEFRKDKEGTMARGQWCGLRRVMQIDYAEGLLMLDVIDRQRREAQGVHELPFAGDT